MRLNATGLDSGLIRYWQGHQQAILTAQGQLASGLRINGASQDAAGLSIATKLSAQIRGHQAASRGMLDGLSMLRLADGGMGDVMTNLQRMRELTLQAANGTLTAAERTAIEAELDELSAGIDQIVDGTHFNTMRILGGPAAASSLSSATLIGRTPISLYTATPATTASILGGLVSLNTSTAQIATSATVLTGAIALDLSNQQTAEQATMQMDSVVLNTATSTPAESAILISERVQVSPKNEPASIKGGNVIANGSSTDYGTLIINGVETTIGTYPPDPSDPLYDETATYNANDDRAAALWIAKKINAKAENTVTAMVAPSDKKIELVSKAAGPTSYIEITQAAAATGLSLTNGKVWGSSGGGSTDLGSITINNVTVALGTLSNTGISSQSAAAYIAQKIKESSLFAELDVSVGGDFGDQIILTSRTKAATSSITVQSVLTSSNGPTSDDGYSGFKANMTAVGKDAFTAMTDLGSVIIDGVTTTFGRIETDNYSPTTAAQYMAQLINDNPLNTSVTATVAGENQDQILLTAKVAGAQGFEVEAATNDSNTDTSDDGTNGFKTGLATGQDADGGTTDFGSITITSAATGPVTLNLGVFDNDSGDLQTALGGIIATINGAVGGSIGASLSGNQILLTAQDEGTAGNFTVASTTARNGFTTATTTPGVDASAGTTDFGSITINGTVITFDPFDNSLGTAAAAQMIVTEINDAVGNSVKASPSGNQIILTSQTPGAAGNFTLAVTPDSNGNGTDNGSIGLSTGTTTSGQDGTSGITDFGWITINGTPIELGDFNSATETDASVAAILAGKITGAGAGVTATVSNGRLVLTSDDPTKDVVIQNVTADSNGDTSDDASAGFLTGDADSPGGSAEDAGSKTLSQGIIIQLGADAGQTIELKTPLDAYADTLGVNAVNMDVSTQAAASVTLRRIDAAMEQAGTIRTSLGASMNRVEHALAVSLNTSQNLGAAESRIMDADLAGSVLAMTRSQLASQAAQSMLKHMNFSRSRLLELLA